MNFKKVLFTISVLSFGLVLSACNNEDTNIEEQENIQSQLEESQEVNQEEQVNNEEIEEQEEIVLKEELDINRWREYENEYFDVKFKYHNNWYFQRDNLNQENYIAVYGFTPSLEELQNKEYAIKLFILNSEDSFNEDFNIVKEKQGNNKKYILVSNNNEYQDILDLMFENLEVMSEEDLNMVKYKDLVKINSFSENQEVTSPLLITGQARGTWFFESDFPVKLTSTDGKIIAKGIAATKDEWMTEDFVNFETELIFEKGDYEKGLLILEKDNPSGLLENEDSFTIPVNF